MTSTKNSFPTPSIFMTKIVKNQISFGVNIGENGVESSANWVWNLVNCPGFTFIAHLKHG